MLYEDQMISSDWTAGILSQKTGAVFVLRMGEAMPSSRSTDGIHARLRSLFILMNR